MKGQYCGWKNRSEEIKTILRFVRPNSVALKRRRDERFSEMNRLIEVYRRSFVRDHEKFHGVWIMDRLEEIVAKAKEHGVTIIDCGKPDMDPANPVDCYMTPAVCKATKGNVLLTGGISIEAPAGFAGRNMMIFGEPRVVLRLDMTAPFNYSSREADFMISTTGKNVVCHDRILKALTKGEKN